jgi:hypothetical protein
VSVDAFYAIEIFQIGHAIDSSCKRARPVLSLAKDHMKRTFLWHSITRDARNDFVVANGAEALF